METASPPSSKGDSSSPSPPCRVRSASLSFSLRFDGERPCVVPESCAASSLPSLLIRPGRVPGAAFGSNLTRRLFLRPDRPEMVLIPDEDEAEPAAPDDAEGDVGAASPPCDCCC